MRAANLGSSGRAAKADHSAPRLASSSSGQDCRGRTIGERKRYWPPSRTRRAIVKPSLSYSEWSPLSGSPPHHQSARHLNGGRSPKKGQFRVNKIKGFRGASCTDGGREGFLLFRPRISQRKASELGLALVIDASPLPFGVTAELLFADHTTRSVESIEAMACAESAMRVVGRLGKFASTLAAIV